MTVPSTATSTMASRLGGLVAFTLGVIGSALAIAAGVVAIVFVIGANNIVDDVAERIKQPIDRLESRIAETSATASSMDGGELSARVKGIADQSESAEAAVGAITEHPLYSRLPVDVIELEDRVRSTTEQAREISTLQTGDVSDAGRTRIAESLDSVAQSLADVDTLIEDTTDSLRFWIRLSGLLCVALSLWGLWAQIALAHQGRRAMRRPHRPKVAERELPANSQHSPSGV